MMKRFLSALVLGLCAAVAAPAATAPRRPNVVLILADDLGYGDLGCYGQTRIRTPNIDRLAREGMRFTQFYSGSTVCAPTRSTLFTGKHTGHTTIRGNGDVPLSAEDLTLSQLFRSARYRVTGIGKWGLGLGNTTGEPRAKGFNQWVGYLDQTEAHDYYPEMIWRYDSVANWNGYRQNPGRGYIHDLFNKAMENAIRFDADFQFFLYLPFTIPHANPKLKELGMQVPTDAPYGAEDWPQPEKNKAAMITRLDESVGLLRRALEQHRLQRDTIILFTSDNGPHDKGGVDPGFFKSAGPFRGIKRDLYEGGIRVPLIVWWPGVVKAGAVSEEIAAMWDLLPTLAEVAGVKAPPEIDGISLLPTWTGGPQTNRHDHLYWEFHERGFQQAVRMDHWKGLRLGGDAGFELYDLTADPGETTNVAKDHPEVVSRIEQIMETARTPSVSWPVPGVDRDSEPPPVSPPPAVGPSAGDGGVP